MTIFRDEVEMALMENTVYIYQYCVGAAGRYLMKRRQRDGQYIYTDIKIVRIRRFN